MDFCKRLYIPAQTVQLSHFKNTHIVTFNIISFPISIVDLSILLKFLDCCSRLLAFSLLSIFILLLYLLFMHQNNKTNSLQTCTAINPILILMSVDRREMKIMI